MATLRPETFRALRKDFLLLARQVEKVTDAATAFYLNEGFVRFGARLYDFVYRGLVPALEKREEKGWADLIRRDCWPFYLGLQLPMLDRTDPERGYYRFLAAKKKWTASLAREARKTWARIEDFFNYLARSEGSEELSVSLPEEIRTEVAGFAVSIEGDPEAAGRYREGLDEALRRLRERASRTFPLLLRDRVPFIFNLHDADGFSSDDAARYDLGKRAVILTKRVTYGKIEDRVHILAHELAHHVYETYLSESDQDFWSSAIRGDYGPVSLREVVEAWPRGGSERYWLYGPEGDRLRKTDPTLYLQISIAMHPPNRDEGWFETLDDVKRLIAEGRETLPLPSHPITLYATKNSEEAFCEAIGRLVGYGPRAVDPYVLSLLKQIVPNLKSASLKTSAHEKSVALMKFLSSVARRLGVAGDVYVVGGAVRNYLLGVPIKDIDVVVDSIALGGGRDSEWFAREVAKAIPVETSLVTNQYGVAILTVKGEWYLDGKTDLLGEVIEIANARKESYDGAGGKGKGYKPSDVSPATIEEDVYRREFTFNTLLWRLLDLADGPERAEVIDLTGLGRSHLAEKLISTPVDPDKTFRDDPTRMLRLWKFLLRYGLKIDPAVRESVRRNADALRNMPWEAVGSILVGDILRSPKAVSGLRSMKELGILDVLVRMISETPPFAAYLSGQLANGPVAIGVLLDLADLGIAGRVLSFLSSADRARFRETIEGWDPAEARAYLETLRNPPVQSLPIIEEFDLVGKDRGTIALRAREILLEMPEIRLSPEALQEAVRATYLTPPSGDRMASTPDSLRVALRYAAETNLLRLPALRRTKILGKTYVLSDRSHIGEDVSEEEDDAGRYRFFWMADDAGRIGMWSTVSGSNKLLGPLSAYRREAERVSAKRALNRVTRSEFDAISRYFDGKEEDYTRALELAADEMKTDADRDVEALVRKMFSDRVVAPLAAQFRDIDRGATPIGFRFDPESRFSREYQAKSFLLYRRIDAEFSPDAVEEAVNAESFYGADPQTASWTRMEVITEFARSLRD